MTISEKEEARSDGDPAGRPHAVALPYPMQGHINPMIHLCKRLASMGLSISFVNTQSNHDRLARSRARAGLPSLRDQGFEITMLAISDGLADEEHDAHHGGEDEALQKSLIAAEKMEAPFSALLQELLDRGERVDCVISDAFLGWSQDVAGRFGLPRVALWSSSAEYCLLNYHLPELHKRGYTPIRDPSILDDYSRTIDFIDGVAPLLPRDLPTILQSHSVHDPGFAKRAARTRRLRDAAWVFCNTFQDLEPEALRAIQEEIGARSKRFFSPVGPLLPTAFLGLGGGDLGGNGLWIEDDRCVRWLDKQSPSSVIYVSFGSLAVMDAAQMRELARGIESSKQPFLWVIRPGSAHGFDLQGFAETTKNIGLVVEWAPQLQVLFHPSVGGFLSHCGWNSTIESVAMGVPVIGLPCVAEQSMNCKRAAVDWKFGCRLPRRSDGMVSGDEIARVLTRFMTGEVGMEQRIRARELREAARRCVMDGGSSHKNLEAFVHAVKTNGLA